jgi:riboflavin kinase/FMN adenylyltransferase
MEGNDLNHYTILIKIEIMKFISTQIKGKGRGRPIGFPTINLKIPDDFELNDGIYASKVNIENKVFVGALHYGPVPTFNESEKSLEVYLIGLDNKLENLNGKIIKVEIVEYLRPVMKFKSKEELVKQIKEDVINIKKITNKK